MNKNAVFTIISKNYLAQARVFANSYRKYNKGSDIYVLLVDRIHDYFDPKKEIFKTIEAEKLNIPNKKSFLFKYNILELNTAVKPYFFSYLFKKYNYKNILYFDPDILITNNLSSLFTKLKKSSILLTPHITQPINDKKTPNEIDYLKSGIFNLGFIGLANTVTTTKFLNWWEKRLYKYCYHKTKQGLFVDQKWANFIPSFTDDYEVIYEPGYNVAYWNFLERKVKINSRNLSKSTVNKQPLYFFHFSGFSPDKPHLVSKHQNRFQMSDISNLKPTFLQYGKMLKNAGFDKVKKYPYHYATFENNVFISQAIRDIYSNPDNNLQDKFPNPFSVSNSNTFQKWLNKDRKHVSKKTNVLTNLMYLIYKNDPNLQNSFPKIFGDDQMPFLEWFNYEGFKKYQIDKFFLAPLKGSLIQTTLLNKIKKLFCWIFYSPLIQNNKYELKRLFGSKYYYTIRNIIKTKKLSISKYKKSTKTFEVTKKGREMFGLNISGHLSAASGTGQAVRSLIRSAEEVRIPLEKNNFDNNIYRKKDISLKNYSQFNPYKVNLICINADQTDLFYNTVSQRYFENKYNIGYWLWEQSEFPKQWLDRFKYFDEIWTASTFAQESISKCSPIPVIKIPLSVQMPLKTKFNRDYFNIKHNKFVFLYIFDYLSVYERKNPEAVIKAFKKALGSSTKAQLVVKTVNAKYNKNAQNKLRRLATGKNVIFIDEYISREELNSLLNCCDCYISLHRSEGFGYTIFEAMYYCKPVIVTPYSGVTDIINVNNSYPVKYRIKTLDKDYGPYKKGTVWAEPNVYHAAEQIQKAFQNKKLNKTIGQKGKSDVRQYLSNKGVGKLILDRINTIKAINF